MLVVTWFQMAWFFCQPAHILCHPGDPAVAVDKGNPGGRYPCFGSVLKAANLCVHGPCRAAVRSRSAAVEVGTWVILRDDYATRPSCFQRVASKGDRGSLAETETAIDRACGQDRIIERIATSGNGALHNRSCAVEDDNDAARSVQLSDAAGFPPHGRGRTMAGLPGGPAGGTRCPHRTGYDCMFGHNRSLGSGTGCRRSGRIAPVA